MAYFGSNPFADQFQAIPTLPPSTRGQAPPDWASQFQAIPTLPASTRGQFTQGQPAWQDMFLRRMAGMFEPAAARAQGLWSSLAPALEGSMPYLGAPTQGRASPGGYGQNINALRSLFAGPVAYGNDVGASGAFLGPPQGDYGADVLEKLKGGGGYSGDAFTNILQNANALRNAWTGERVNDFDASGRLGAALPGFAGPPQNGYGNDFDSSGHLGSPVPGFGGPGASRRDQLFAGASQAGNALRLVQQAGGFTKTAEEEEAFKLAQGGSYGNDVLTPTPQGGYRADISEGPPNLSYLPAPPRFQGPGVSRGKALTSAGSGGLFRKFM